MSDFIEYLKRVRQIQKDYDECILNKSSCCNVQYKTAEHINPRDHSPYISENGDLIIPFTSDDKYHWWKHGQSVRETLLELGADDEIMTRYVANWIKRKSFDVN